MDTTITALQVASVVPIRLSRDAQTGHLIIDGAVAWSLNRDRTRLNIYSGEPAGTIDHVHATVPLRCLFQQITQCGSHHLEVLDHRLLDHERLNIRISDVPRETPSSFSMPPPSHTYAWISVVIGGNGSIDGGQNRAHMVDFRVDGHGHITNFAVTTEATLLLLGAGHGTIDVRTLASTRVHRRSDGLDSNARVQIVDHF